MPVFPENREIRALRTGPGQESYIETVEQCLQEAAALPLWRPLAIYANGQLAGFAMYGLWKEEGETGRVWLDRFLIDARFQGRGIATAALPLLMDRLFAEYGHDALYLSLYADNKAAEHVYTKLGFRYNGERDVHGELVMVYHRPTVLRAELHDAGEAGRLALLLWPAHTLEELTREMSALIASPEAAVFLAMAEGKSLGFAQCQLRHDYVEGTGGDAPVGYLEGIYVEESHRRQGVARALLAACENWAKTQGCREFASDCELDNDQSLHFHLGAGFREVNRVICFVKELA